MESQYRGPAIGKLDKVEEELSTQEETYVPPFSYGGIEPLMGILETVDYLTAAPVRTGLMEVVKNSKSGSGGPWDFFKGMLKSYKNPMTAPTGKDIARELGLSDKSLSDNTGRLSFGGIASKLSPSEIAGFVGENLLDAENLIPAGKAMAVGGLALGGLKKVGKYAGENLLEQAKKFKNVDDFIRSTTPKAGEIVDGLKVRSDVPNMESIGSTFDDYDIEEGIKEIPINNFELTGKSYSPSETQRIKNLAEQIAYNKEINPLIVVRDNEGYYILEGGHRAEALYSLGKKKIPAIIVNDLSTVGENKEIKNLKQIWESTQANQPLTNSLSTPKDPNILKGLAPVGPWIYFKNQKEKSDDK